MGTDVLNVLRSVTPESEIVLEETKRVEDELIEEIDFPENPANICFGGKKRKTLFVTARKGVYTLQMNVKGVD